MFYSTKSTFGLFFARPGRTAPLRHARPAGRDADDTVKSLDVYITKKLTRRRHIHRFAYERGGRRWTYHGGAFAPPMACRWLHISYANLCICHLLVSFLLCRLRRSLGRAWRSGAVRPGRAKKTPIVVLFTSKTMLFVNMCFI